MTDKGTKHGLLSATITVWPWEFGKKFPLWLHLHYQYAQPLIHTVLINVTIKETRSNTKVTTLLSSIAYVLL